MIVEAITFSQGHFYPTLEEMFRVGQADPQAPKQSGRLGGGTAQTPGKFHSDRVHSSQWAPHQWRGPARPEHEQNTHQSRPPGGDWAPHSAEAVPEFINSTRWVCPGKCWQLVDGSLSQSPFLIRNGKWEILLSRNRGSYKAPRFKSWDLSSLETSFPDTDTCLSSTGTKVKL